MRLTTIAVASTVMMALAGCQGVNGPFSCRPSERVDDPRLTIAEQERRGRDRWALPDQTPLPGPQTWMEPPGAGAHGR